jgi:hypothetical protein
VFAVRGRDWTVGVVAGRKPLASLMFYDLRNVVAELGDGATGALESGDGSGAAAGAPAGGDDSSAGVDAPAGGDDSPAGADATAGGDDSSARAEAAPAEEDPSTGSAPGSTS